MGETLASVRFRLSSPFVDFDVDVHLRDCGGRWFAAADRGGEMQIGIGRNAREAIVASLSKLGPRASGALLADPGLVGASLAL
jgi:hypothetical protein